jgi:hypothetical protein
LAVSAPGDVVLEGVASGVDLGGGNVWGLVIGKFSAAGHPAWSKGLAVPAFSESALFPAIALDRAAGLFLVGGFGLNADFGGGVVDPGNRSAVFVARYQNFP